MRIEVLPEAQFDLVSGFRFYELQTPGLGHYFLDSLSADIDLLADHGGIHASVLGYYRVENRIVRIRAILDCRRRPSWIRQRLRDQ